MPPAQAGIARQATYQAAGRAASVKRQGRRSRQRGSVAGFMRQTARVKRQSSPCGRRVTQASRGRHVSSGGSRRIRQAAGAAQQTARVGGGLHAANSTRQAAVVTLRAMSCDRDPRWPSRVARQPSRGGRRILRRVAPQSSRCGRCHATGIARQPSRVARHTAGAPRQPQGPFRPDAAIRRSTTRCHQHASLRAGLQTAADLTRMFLAEIRNLQAVQRAVDTLSWRDLRR